MNDASRRAVLRALALPVLAGAARALQDVATFDAAGVVDKTDG